MKKLFQHQKLFSIIFALLALTMVFVGGLFSSNTHIEKVASYATEVVNNYTTEKKYCAVTVSKSEDGPAIADPISEFNNLYGVFRQQKVTFASAINPHKERTINSTFSPDNLSLLYVGAVGTIEYKGHYRHAAFPIELMFADVDTYDVGRYKAYISMTHANKLLDEKGIPKINGDYSPEDYQSLIKELVPINIDGQYFDFVIQNIYFESNYYYEGINDVMGDFIMVSYYLPLDLRNEQHNLYFMSEYTYQNKYFMDYINNVYANKDYSVRVSHFNLKQGINDEYFLSFYYSGNNSNLNWLSTLCFVFAFLLLLLSLIIFLYIGFVCNRRILFRDCLIVSFSMFIPYIIFYLFSKILSEPLIVSEVSSRVNGIVILFYFLIISFCSFLTKHNVFKKARIMHGDNFYEIDI